MAIWFKYAVATVVTLSIVGVAIFLCILCWSWSRTAEDLSALTLPWADAAPAPDKLNEVADSLKSGTLQVAGAASQMADEVTGTAGAGAMLLETTSKAVAKTSDNLNRPCKGLKGADACGALAQVNKTVIKAGDAIVQTQRAEENAIPHMTAAMDALKDSVNNSMNPALAAFTKMLNSPDLATAMNQSAGIATDLHGITTDAKKEADKAVAPKTKLQQALPWIPFGIRVGGSVACLASGAC